MSVTAERLRARFYNSDPSWVNGTEAFARVVRRCLRPEMRILNLGAGAGTSSLHFDNHVRTVVGLDPDVSIASHRRLSHKVLGVAERLPFREGSFDLVYMDWVIEHLPSPGAMATEAWRVLKEDGYLLFRTGNLLHYSYAIAALTPRAFHQYLVDTLFGDGEAHTHPTFYRMNTVAKVRSTMKLAGFAEQHLAIIEPDPAYVGMSAATFLVGVAYERLVNRFEVLRPLRANIMCCFRKSAVVHERGHQSEKSVR